jgi:hypothetical protein
VVSGFHSRSKQELGTVKHGVLFHAEVCDFQFCSFREVGWVFGQDFGEFDEVFFAHVFVMFGMMWTDNPRIHGLGKQSTYFLFIFQPCHRIDFRPPIVLTSSWMPAAGLGPDGPRLGSGGRQGSGEAAGGGGLRGGG